MDTLELTYGGDTFWIVGRSIYEVQQEIGVLLRSGNPAWLEVRDSHGGLASHQLLLGIGVPLSITSVPSA